MRPPSPKPCAPLAFASAALLDFCPLRRQLPSSMTQGHRQKSTASSNRFDALMTTSLDPCQVAAQHVQEQQAVKDALSAPARLKRKWEPRREPAGPFCAVTVMTYNVLAQNYMSGRQFPKTPKPYRQAAYRRRAIVHDIARHVEEYQVDVLCLQELECDEVKRFALELPEFDGVSYRQRTSIAAKNKRDGSGVFWRRSRFTETLPDSKVADFHVVFNDIADDPVLSRVCTPPALCIRDNVGALTVLTEISSGTKLVVGSVHLFWNPEFEALKLAQAGVFRRAAFDLAAATDTKNVIIAGDLNSLPDSVTYRFLTKDGGAEGHADVVQLPDDALKAATELSAADEGLRSFVEFEDMSGAEEADGPLSTLTHKFRGCLDHILAAPGCVCVGSLSLPTAKDFAEAKIDALPCAGHPSDHVPQIARLAIERGVVEEGKGEGEVLCEEIAGLKI